MYSTLFRESLDSIFKIHAFQNSHKESQRASPPRVLHQLLSHVHVKGKPKDPLFFVFCFYRVHIDCHALVFLVVTNDFIDVHGPGNDFVKVLNHPRRS